MRPCERDVHDRTPIDAPSATTDGLESQTTIKRRLSETPAALLALTAAVVMTACAQPPAAPMPSGLERFYGQQIAWETCAGTNSCVNEIAAAYLIELTQPPEGTSCPL